MLKPRKIWQPWFHFEVLSDGHGSKNVALPVIRATNGFVRCHFGKMGCFLKEALPFDFPAI
jgi:hypothetical protein